ncbi:MAG: hypothetical protein Crog4KO_35650 [Crocinitomicaceae bacterium]
MQKTQAADFTVNDAASLIAAINTANANGEDDVITLSGNITLTAIDNLGTDGNNGLPVIIADGGNSLTINGNGFTINRASASDFRIMEVGTGANLTLNNLNLSDGVADSGGGIYVDNSTVMVTNSTISGNTAEYEGGGIYNRGDLSITNSTISGNSTDLFVIGYGGGIRNQADLSITNSTISDNTAIEGGGIYTNNVTVMVTNSTISGNMATNEGGGIYAGDDLSIINSTISDNTAGDDGGGIYYDFNLILTNSIIAGNTANGTNDECFADRPLTASTNNIFGTGGDSGDCPAGTNDIVPAGAIGTILAPLGNNGSVTQTHALVPNSPAIDAANNANCPASDQRGAERGVDGIGAVNDPELGDCDIGAFELAGVVPTVTVGTVSAVNILETGGTASISVTVADLAVGDSITIFASISGGTATVDTDYRITQSLTFNANSTQDFTITSLTDALVEGNETLTVSFSLQGAANISANGNWTVTILDVNPPLFSKAFAPDTITVGDISSLTFTIDNSANGVVVNNLDFTDNLPAGMIVATPANASTTCTGGTVTAVDGSGTVSYTGGTVGAGASCTVVLDVTGNTAGALFNTTGDLTSSLGNSGTASDMLTLTTPSASDSSGSEDNSNPEISVFDPAISKIGFLLPGQVGVTGEQLEWIVTVSNTGNAVGNNVSITDTLNTSLQVDRVDAPNAQVSINGQTVTVTYATLNIGETVQFSIFTTVLDGVLIENTACVTASNQGAEECATSFPVAELPQTGELPFWRNLLLMIGIVSVIITSLLGVVTGYARK